MRWLNNFDNAFRAILHPKSNRKPMSVENAIKFYYNISIVPLIIAIVANLILVTGFGYSPFTSYNILSPVQNQFAPTLFISILIAIGYPVLYLLILIPVTFLLNAAIYQLFSKTLFNLVNRNYHRTLTAFVYGQIPALFFFWAFGIPILGLVIIVATAIWGIIVLVQSLAQQQEITSRQALGTWLLGIFTFIAVVILIILAITLPLLGTGALPMFP